MIPEAEKPHLHHRTRHRWLDLVFGVSAMVVSVVSLFLAVHYGQTMERMADANAKLVAANSWPFLQYSTDNVGPNGERRIDLNIEDVGIGPAKIESVELWWHNTPIASLGALFAACCGYSKALGTAPPLSGQRAGAAHPQGG